MVHTTQEHRERAAKLFDAMENGLVRRWVDGELEGTSPARVLDQRMVDVAQSFAQYEAELKQTYEPPRDMTHVQTVRRIVSFLKEHGQAELGAEILGIEGNRALDSVMQPNPPLVYSYSATARAAVMRLVHATGAYCEAEKRLSGKGHGTGDLAKAEVEMRDANNDFLRVMSADELHHPNGQACRRCGGALHGFDTCENGCHNL